MPFDRDAWLMDPKSRQEWVRTAGLSELVLMLLRTSGTVAECLECLVDEVLSTSQLSPRRRSSLKRTTIARARAEQPAWTRWLTRLLKEPPPRTVRSLWFHVTEGAPYEVRLSGSRLLATSDSYDWVEDRAWESRAPAPSDLLRDLERLLAPVDVSTRALLVYLLPIAYPAFIVKRASSSRPSLFANPEAERAVVVGYEDGDFFPVLIPTSPEVAGGPR
jgi:hypothetical protein